jgi:hypothetical protein
MKKLLLFASMVIFLGCQNLWANQAADFQVDKQQVLNEFSELNQLEQTVIQNDFMSLSEMQSKNMISSRYGNLNLTNGMMMEPALGIPGFWWGCVFGPVGILIVYLVTDNDRDEVKKSLYGCIVSGAFWIAWEVFWLVVYGNSFLI